MRTWRRDLGDNAQSLVYRFGEGGAFAVPPAAFFKHCNVATVHPFCQKLYVGAFTPILNAYANE